MRDKQPSGAPTGEQVPAVTGDGATSPDPQARSGAASPRVLGFWRVPFFYGWIIVAVVFVAEFVGSGVGGLVVPLFFKPMSDETGWSLTLLTGAITAQTIAYSAVSPFLGRAVDRFGARPVMLWGAVVAGAGLILLTRVHQVWQFWILYAAVGALGLHEMGGFTGPVMVTKWFVRLRGRAMALASMGNSVGAMVMALVLGFLIAAIGWRDTWGLLGVGILVIMVPTALLFVRNQPEDMGLQPDGDEPETTPSPKEVRRGAPRLSTRTEVSWTLKEAMRTRALWLLIIAMNLVQFSIFVLVLHMVPFLTIQQGMSPQLASLVLSLRMGASTFSRALWGFAVERVPVNLCLAIAFLSRALIPIALVLLPFPANVVFVVVANFPGGGLQILQPLAFANFFGRRHAGSIQGATRPFLTVSTLLGPLLISIVFDITGTFNVAFLVAGALGVVSAVVVLFITPPQKPAEAPRSEPQTAAS